MVRGVNHMTGALPIRGLLRVRARRFRRLRHALSMLR